MARNENQESLGEVINRMLEMYHLKSGLTEVTIRSEWENLVGALIASRTDEVFLRGQKLVIRLSSAALKQELHYQRQDIADNINRHFGRRVVETVELW